MFCPIIHICILLLMYVQTTKCNKSLNVKPIKLNTYAALAKFIEIHTKCICYHKTLINVSKYKSKLHSRHKPTLRKHCPAQAQRKTQQA